MLDLSSETPEIISSRIGKFTSILELIKPEEHQNFSYLLEIAHYHINQNHSDLSKEWKALAIIVLKHNYNNISNEKDIETIIDNFVDFYKTNYTNYCNENEIIINEEERIFNFIRFYNNTKINIINHISNGY